MCREGLEAWEGDNQLCLLKTKKSSVALCPQEGSCKDADPGCLEHTVVAFCVGREEKFRNRMYQQERER